MGTPETLRFIAKLINIGCACLIIVMSVLELIPEIIEFWHWIFFFYQVMFAILILAAEMSLQFVLKYFKFLEGKFGKGWFLIFCGMWMIGCAASSGAEISGYCIIGSGVITFILMCMSDTQAQKS